MNPSCPHCGGEIPSSPNKIHGRFQNQTALLSRAAAENMKRLTKVAPQFKVAPVSNASDYLPPLNAKSKTPSKMEFLPLAIGMTAALAVTSGIYLLLETQSIESKSRATSFSKLEEAPPTGISEGPEIVKAPPLISSTAIMQRDQVHETAMAPIRPTQEPARDPIPPALQIQVIGDHAHLHTGPGLNYPIIAEAYPENSYAVLSWNGKWFKIRASNSEPDGQIDTIEGWLRNDLVQVTSKNR